MRSLLRDHAGHRRADSSFSTIVVSTAVAALLGLAGCGQGGSSGSSLTSSSGGFGSSAAVSAAKKADFMAIRRYTSFLVGTASYTERFVHADDGRTLVELLSVNGETPQTMTPDEYVQFQTQQQLLNGGRGRFVAAGRDFAVRDAARFLQNYTVSLVSSTAVVAGRRCVVTEVFPKLSDRPHYMVWADSETFVTLKYLEYLPIGVLAAEMETLDVNYTYNAKQDQFPTLPITTPVDVTNSQWSGLVGFKAFTPAYLPGGFLLDSVKLASIATRPVLTCSYDDGLQEIFVAQYTEEGTPEVEPPNYPPNAPIQIHLDVYGGYVRTAFVVDGTMVHIEGKVEPEEVKSVIESLNPAGP